VKSFEPTTTRALCEYITSGSRDWKSFYSDTGALFIRTQDINKDRLDLNNAAYVSLPEKIEGKRSRLKAGDLLVTITGANVGKVALVPHGIPEAYVSQSVGLMRLKDPRNGPYLHYYLQGEKAGRKHLLGLVYGMGRPVLSLENLREVPVLLPDLETQRAIVANIEEQFSRLDAGIAALRRAQANLRRYRASVLNAACQGNLVAVACELQPLGSVIGEISQGWSPKCDTNRSPEEDEWAVIKTTAIQPMRYESSEAKPLPPKFSPRTSIEIQAGDFLMTRKGPRKRTGVACYVRSTRKHSIVCDTVYTFRCIESRTLPSYLEIALNSLGVTTAIDKLKSGIDDSGVSLTHGKLRSVLIPVPSLSDQRRIIAEVERRLSVVGQLEGTIAADLLRAARLRRSVLHQAFMEKG
jgi:type I restriction enzyme, S subunit